MRKVQLTLVALASVSALGAGPALAQSPDAASAAPQAAPEGGEIIVTARRRAESLEKVPVAVTAVGGEALKSLSVVNAQDLTRVAPSVNFGSAARGGSVPYMGIRGITSGDVTGTVDPSVGIYMNEVIQQRPNGILSSFYDVQAVQVLRGPQGTLFGRNTIGGAILISTVAPKDELGGYVTVGYGNYNAFTAEGVLNIPLTDTLKIRGGGRFAKRDGYVISTETGQDQSDVNEGNGRLSVLWEPSDNFKTTTVASYFKSSTNGTGYTTPGLFPAGQFSNYNFIGANNNVTDPQNRAAIAEAGELRRRNFYRNSTNEIQFDKSTAFDISNTSTLKLNDELTLKNIAGYRYSHASAVVDSDGSRAAQYAVGPDNRFRQYTDELQMQGDIGRFNFIAGAFYFYEKGTEFSFNRGPTPYATRNAPASANYQGGDIRNEAYSAFASGTYEFTDRLKASFGGRYTKDIREFDARSYRVLNPLTNPTSVCLVGEVISQTTDAQGRLVITTQPADPCVIKQQLKSSAFTYSADISYQLDRVLLYISHRKGYHSGALNARATYILPGDFAKPEYLKDIEAGVKANLPLGNANLRINAAAYYGWYDGVQRLVGLPEVILNGQSQVPSSLINAASARLGGVELESTLSMRNGLEVSGYFAFNDTHYTKFCDAAAKDPRTNPPGPCLDRTNDLFTYAPRYTGGATVRYVKTLDEYGTVLNTQVNFFATSKFNTNASQQPIYTILPGYHLLNGRFSLENMKGTGATISLFMNNILGAKYYTGGTTVAPLGISQQTVGAPRMFGVELTYRFGGER